MEMKEKMQYQAVLAITGASWGTDPVNFYTELGWELLSDHRIGRHVL